MDMATAMMGLVMGTLLGVLLHRVGATRADNIWNMLRLKDMTLLKYMFTAAAVAMLGSVVLEASHVMVVMVNPAYVWGTIVGGLLFGIGMALCGYTPSTALCALGERKASACWAVIGGMCGVAVFASVYPMLLLAMEGWVMGSVTWANFIPLPYSTVAVIAAWGLYMAATRMKGRAGKNVVAMPKGAKPSGKAQSVKATKTTKAKKAS